jgi:hypothetical protein
MLGVPDSFMQFVPYFALVIMGFCGVLFGSLCLEWPSRRFGSIALLIIGLTFYIGIMFSIQYPGMVGDEHPYLWLWGLGALLVGGLTTVIFIFCRSLSNTSTGIGVGSSASQSTSQAASGRSTSGRQAAQKS